MNCIIINDDQMNGGGDQMNGGGDQMNGDQMNGGGGYIDSDDDERMDGDGGCMDGDYMDGDYMDGDQMNGGCMDGDCMDKEHVNQITMEIESIDLNGNYCYAPDFDIMSYDDKCEKCTECAFCKRNLYEYSYNIITDNKSILNDNKVIIGKCGHMFHKDCMDSWLKHGNTICPIDKVTWEEYRIADNYTALPIVNKKKHNNKYRYRYSKVCKYNN